MLFDLRSRGRRRTVQVVYLGLAFLIGGGLILFGVGTGSGGGGLLGAFTGGGSGGNNNQVVSQQEKTALRQTQQDPSSASAWASLVSARWENASSADYNSSTNTYTAAGKNDLAGATRAWQRYVQLTKSPDPDTAILAARAYAALGEYPGEAQAWEAVTASSPNEIKGYECVAVSAYAAKQTRKGDLAMAKALSLAPKSSRSSLKTQIVAAKTEPTIAQTC